MIKKTILFLMLAILSASLPAQTLSWRKHVKLADEYYKKGRFAEAAVNYRAAWEQKNNKKDLIFKAAECAYLIKDYSAAADAYQHIKDREKQFPKVGLKYGLALKQKGQYEQASRELANFLEAYKGEDKDQVALQVENEIRGCELGLKMLSTPASPTVEVQHLSNFVNTPQTEFAPIPINDELLYFSSTKDGRAQIYRSQMINGEWGMPEIPSAFPIIEEDHFCNGALTPDNKRFYFTICKPSNSAGGGVRTRCELFVTKRIGAGWTEPEQLKDYINLENATTTHPYVVYNGNTEILYFSSNRSGGFGGMDIWFVTRDINSGDLDFTFPINAGSNINSTGDEITPYYDLENAQLYFASNGQVTIGGYDIFRSKGSRTQWSTIENIGLPYNSSADDFFFIESPSKKSGFFVSNRTFEPTKLTTIHEDLFSFSDLSEANTELVLSGRIYDKFSGATVNNVSMAVYELASGGNKNLVEYQTFDNGTYQFTLPVGKQYEVEAQKSGFLPATFSFVADPNMPNGTNNRAILMEEIQAEPVAIEDPTPPEEVISMPPPTTTTPDYSESSAYSSSNPNGTTTVPETTAYITRGQTKLDNAEFKTDAPRHQGEYFKIQVTAVSKFDPTHPKILPLEGYGRVDTEFLTERKLTRVLVADYFTLDQAQAVLNDIKSIGYPGAYIVRYKDGQRFGKVR